MTYVCRDYYGNELTVEESGIGGQPDRFVRVYSRGGSYIRDDAAVNLARALCRAAGRDVIILDRPGDFDGDIVNLAGAHDSSVVIYGKLYSPQRAREFAAHIACEADRAESEPDPDEVHELAKHLHQGESALDGPDSYAAARTVLRAGYKREVAT